MNVPHEYGPSRVGHGEAQCKWCLGTNRENAVISPNHCEERAKREQPSSNSLVQRLRAQDKHSTHGDQVERDRLFYLAAAEVERLQSLIRRVIEWQPSFPVESTLLDELAEAVGPVAPRIEGGTPPSSLRVDSRPAVSEDDGNG